MASRSLALIDSTVTATTGPRLKYRFAATTAAATNRIAVVIRMFFCAIYAPERAVMMPAIARAITPYAARKDHAMGDVFLLYKTANPIARLTTHQMRKRSICPRKRATKL